MPLGGTVTVIVSVRRSHWSSRQSLRFGSMVTGSRGVGGMPSTGGSNTGTNGSWPRTAVSSVNGVRVPSAPRTTLATSFGRSSETAWNTVTASPVGNLPSALAPSRVSLPRTSARWSRTAAGRVGVFLFFVGMTCRFRAWRADPQSVWPLVVRSGLVGPLIPRVGRRPTGWCPAGVAAGRAPAQRGSSLRRSVSSGRTLPRANRDSSEAATVRADDESSPKRSMLERRSCAARSCCAANTASST